MFKSENIILSEKLRRLWQFLYWIFAAMLLLFVFSNSQYDFVVRVAVSVIITVISFGISTLINYYLIPRYLFGGKTLRFIYLLVFAVIFSVWINIISVIFIIWYTAYYYPLTALPNHTDLGLLISGSFLIIMFAAIIHFIKETYTKLIERNRAEQQKTETELKLQEAKLKLLQGQLHPHFLFNMLNNLYGLWMENSKSTPEVILKLSSLLDYMLYECDSEKVAMRNEIEFIKNYIDLEKLRHDSRLKVDFTIENSLDNLEIAPLLLFSFVENAFKHGANKTSGESSICIRLKVDDNSLDFEVENTFLVIDESKSRNGIGLKNVEERLNLLYNNQYTLNISTDNNIYRVSLQLRLT